MFTYHCDWNRIRVSDAEIEHFSIFLDCKTKIIHKIFYITKTNILYTNTVIGCASISVQSDSGISSGIPTDRATESSILEI